MIKWGRGDCTFNISFCFTPIFQLHLDDKMWGCPIGWRGFRGSCYQVLKAPNGMTWSNAKSVCSGKFANLATITDANENRFVFSMLPKGKYLHTTKSYHRSCHGNIFHYKVPS